jgi:hypothetical protein
MAMRPEQPVEEQSSQSSLAVHLLVANAPARAPFVVLPHVSSCVLSAVLRSCSSLNQ